MDPEGYLDYYGCLYSWEDAQKVCPCGWHLPSEDEFLDLLKAVGCDETYDSVPLRDFREGSNSSGFTALPAGYKSSGGSGGLSSGSDAYFWSSTEASDFLIKTAVSFHIEWHGADFRPVSRDFDCSVRCVKD